MSDIVKYEQFAIATADMSVLGEVIRENLGTGLTERTLERIKVPSAGGTTWTVPGLVEDEETKELTGIILWWKNSRIFFPNAFSGGGEPPACRSSDGIVGDGEFGPGSAANPTGRCAVCPKAKWGSSDPDDGDSKPACSDRQPVFLLRPQSVMPSILSLPPASLKTFEEFRTKLTQRLMPYYGVIATATLSKQKSAGGVEYSQVDWKAVEVLEPAARDAAKSYHTEIKAMFGTWVDAGDDLVADAPVDASGGGPTDVA